MMHHQKDGDHALGQTYNDSLCGLNYVAGSALIETRYNASDTAHQGSGFPATIAIAGLTPCDNILKAYLYWIISYTSTDSTTSPTLNLTNPSGNNSTTTPSLAGSDGPKCWGESGTYVFRADVTSQISGNGNYIINDIVGDDSWGVDGATLIIIYKDPSASYMGNLILDDGCYTVDGGNTFLTMTGFNACSNSIGGSAFLIASDLQNNVAAGHNDSLNGSLDYFPNNFYNCDIGSTAVTAGQTSADFGINLLGGDCYCWAVMGLYYQTNCTVCTPTSGILPLAKDSLPTACDSADGKAWVIPLGGTPPYTYTWSTSPIQTTQTATGLAGGIYYVTVVDSSGCYSNIDTIRIDSSTSVNITLHPTNPLCFGQSTGQIIADTSGGSGPFTFTWIPSGGNTLTDSGLPIGTYTFTITDSHGCTSRDSVTLTQPPQLLLANSQNNIHCGTLPNSGEAISIPSGGTGTYHYHWSATGSTVDSATSLTIGTYTITVTDANGCTATNAFNITQSATLTQSTAQTNVTCSDSANGTITITVNSTTGPFTYVWSPSVSTTSSANGLASGNYTVVVTDTAGCHSILPFTITHPPALVDLDSFKAPLCNAGNNGFAVVYTTGGTPGYTYQWSPSGGNADTASNLTAGTYTITVRDQNGCTVSATVNVTQPPALTLTSTHTNVLCFGDSTGIATVVPNGGTPAYSYLWSSNGVTAASISTIPSGSYSVTITDANGCTHDTTIVITQPNSPLVATVAVNPVSICEGDTAHLSTSGNGGTPGYSFLWSNGSTNTNQTINPANTSTYYITVTDTNGCVTTDSVTIDIKALPVPVVTSDSVCWGDTAMLWVNNANGGSVHWSTGQTTDSISLMIDSTIHDSVYVIGTNGCRSHWVSDSAVVKGPRIIAGFTSDSTTGYVPLFVNFTNTSTGDYYSHWNFGDLLSGPMDSMNATNAFHLFDSSGIYYVTLYTYNYDGCRDTITEVIDVKKTSSLVVYNTFSPNGDGKNDQWIPNFHNIAATHIEIYDRWGLKIKDWTTLTGWDGTNNGGSAVPDGTYYYILTAEGVDGQLYNQHGYITLIR